jgi:hypothetical protein
MYQTCLKKSTTSIHNNNVHYHLPINDTTTLYLNDHINHCGGIKFLNKIYCCECGNVTKKSFMNGYCFRCFQTAPSTSPCILHPQKCQAHNNIGRDINWEIKNHLQPHHVYLAYTGNLKVGVTRSTQIPTRWIDQGATQAMIIATTPNRYLAGCIEVALKQHISDKTAWQTMLKNGNTTLPTFKQSALETLTHFPQQYNQYQINKHTITTISYPVDSPPTKISAQNLDKSPLITGRLTGIKGQYLLFENNQVFNLRRHTGYQVQLTINNDT